MLYKSHGSKSSIQDVDTKQGIVMGYLSAFDVKDYDGDVVRKGAFAKTIAERGPNGKKSIRFLQDHDKYKNVGHFLELKEDDYGLYYEGKVGNWTAGQDYLKMVEDKIITQHSIGYRKIKEQMSIEGNILSELYLVEGSGLQVDAANPFTPVIGVKSAADYAELFKNLAKALASGTYSDETFKTVIIPQFEYIQEQIKQLTKPSPDTLPTTEFLELIEQFKI